MSEGRPQEKPFRPGIEKGGKHHIHLASSDNSIRLLEIESISKLFNTKCRPAPFFFTAFDDSPMEGVHIRAHALIRPDVVYYGCTDVAGQVWSWSHDDTIETRMCWVRCLESSQWQITVSIPDHRLTCFSVDLSIPRHADASTAMTATIGPYGVDFHVGNPQEAIGRPGLTLGSLDPTLLQPQRSSTSLGSWSDISSFTLDNERSPSWSDTRSASSPGPSVHPPAGASEADEVALEGFLHAQISMEEGEKTKDPLCRKRKHDENGLSDKEKPSKRARAPKGRGRGMTGPRGKKYS